MRRGRRGRTTRAVAAAGLAVLLAGRTAEARNLAELLAAVAANERFEPPARADVTIACTPDCPVVHSTATLVGRGDTLYVEVKDGERALLGPGAVRVAAGGAVKDAPPGTAFAGTDVRLEDLVPFTPASLATPLVSDDGPAGVVVTAAPGGPSSYVLLVETIDPDRRIVTKTQEYEGSIGNLTRFLRRSAFTDVGGHLRPGEIALENLRKGTTTRLTLRWRPMPDAPPSLFDPSTLAKPAGLPAP
ncbi:MAG TPA: hypothetical protein VFD84_00810 [Candidatus Binatia bacterium]|nr:hypothetical protein [Candidatus Binatia bacterium]